MGSDCSRREGPPGGLADMRDLVSVCVRGGWYVIKDLCGIHTETFSTSPPVTLPVAMASIMVLSKEQL